MFDIVSYIMGIQGGGGSGGAGKVVKSVEFLSDNEMKVVYTDDSEALVSAEYEDGNIVSMNVNGVSIGLDYDASGNLIKEGKTDISGMENYISKIQNNFMKVVDAPLTNHMLENVDIEIYAFSKIE